MVVVGFTAGTIPQVKVNRLLSHNTGVIGAAWREWIIRHPDAAHEIAGVVTRLTGTGAIAR